MAFETKWHVPEIMLMPFAQLVQIRHCQIVKAGYWTLAPDAAPDEQFERLQKFLAGRADTTTAKKE